MPEPARVRTSKRKIGAMGKVRDELSAQKSSKPSKSGSGPRQRGAMIQFVVNLVRSDLYKPMQGWYARLYTALGLGLIALAGAYQISQASLEYAPVWRFGIPAVFAIAGLWVIFRVVHFPPFADFLIATEAEMNKVSWTTKDDLVRATTVVLSTVVVMAVFLFVVDRLWTFILQMIGVLKFGGGGGFGSTA
jgi:preprotein translocase subunit SecE